MEVEIKAIGIGEVEGIEAGMEVGCTTSNQRKRIFDIVGTCLEGVVNVLILCLLDHSLVVSYAVVCDTVDYGG